MHRALLFSGWQEEAMREPLRRGMAGVLAAFGLAVVVSAQPGPDVQAVRRWRQQNETAILNEMVSLASLPNITGDQPALVKNAQFISEMLTRRGIAVRTVSVTGGAPVVVGNL